jgi:hypothetical protein
MGRTTEARQHLDELNALGIRAYVPPRHVAMLYMALGDREQALLCLQGAYDERAIFCLKVNPIWDPLRSDPRFQRLLANMGLG